MDVTLTIKKNRKEFNKLKQKFINKPSHEFAKSLVELLMSGVYAKYYDNTIEEFYINYSNRNKKLRSDFKLIKPNHKTYLHVASEVYLLGGHTRMIERWVGFSDNDEKHSVVLLNQKDIDEIPEKIKRNVAIKKGVLKILNPSDELLDKANTLRDLAFEYDIIILHHHPDDPVPLMAFSVEEFKRPIICFNHSGHTFWLGRNIVDFCIDIEKNQNKCTIEKRGIPQTLTIDMPRDMVQEHDNDSSERNNIKAELGIANNSLIVSSMASNYKFKPLKNINFIDTIRNILEKNKKAFFLGIGMSDKDEGWDNLKDKFPNRLLLLGVIPHNRALKYLKAVDLYIDSFPYNSWVSLIDAISIGRCACLVLKTPVGYPNFLENTDVICSSTEELISKANFLLESKEKRESFFDNIQNVFIEKTDPNYFRKILKNVYDKVKLSRNIEKKSMLEKSDITLFDTYNYLFRNISSYKRFGLKGIVEFVRIKSFSVKKIEIYLLNVKIFKIEIDRLLKQSKKIISNNQKFNKFHEKYY